MTLNTSDCSNSEKSKFRPLKWGFSQFQKKPRGSNKTTIDGLPLSKEGLCQLQHLINFLSIEENVIQEGIFRRSGKVTRQQELKSLLSQGLNINLPESQYSVHDVATVLKSYLAELPEPLVTENHYPAYCQVADYCRQELGTKSRVLRALQLLLLLLPYPNRRLLKSILKLLHLIASRVDKNKMSPQNLATLFTPHLLVPRKLTPEVFHTAAQSLSCIVVFMINHGHEVFDVPQALATDIKAYWDRRRNAPNYLLERSISEGTAAKTVFSFVDRERTAQENVVNPTETALAQLYAHIQSLPESNKKKRLIKQFNKENGQGTPRTRSIGDSIKKHIFNKHIKGKVLADISHLKYEGFKDVCSGSLLQDEIKSPESSPIVKKVGIKLNFNDDEDDTEEKEEQAEESDVDEEVSPLEDLSEGCAKLTPDRGGYDYAQKSEACSCFIGLQSVPPWDKLMGYQGPLLGESRGQQNQIGELYRERRGANKPFPRLPLQSERSDREPSRFEFLQQDGGLRPVVVARRQRVKRVPPVLPRWGEPSVFQPQFWLPPFQEGEARAGPTPEQTVSYV